MIKHNGIFRGTSSGTKKMERSEAEGHPQLESELKARPVSMRLCLKGKEKDAETQLARYG